MVSMPNYLCMHKPLRMYLCTGYGWEHMRALSTFPLARNMNSPVARREKEFMNFLIARDITAGSRIPARMYGRILGQAPRKRYLAFLLKQNIT